MVEESTLTPQKRKSIFMVTLKDLVDVIMHLLRNLFKAVMRASLSHGAMMDTEKK